MPKITIQKGIPEYFVKQSPSDIMPRLPGANALIVGPSRAGKSTAMVSMILDKDKFRNLYSRIFIWSPSIDVDDSWGPVKDYITRELGHDESREGPFAFNYVDPEDMRRIAKKQQKITET